MSISSTSKARNGKGSAAWRRIVAAGKARYKRNGWPCPECGQPFDFDNPQSARGFTGDHPIALANGGTLIGQKTSFMCRSCNARKNDVVTPNLAPATLPPHQQDAS